MAEEKEPDEEGLLEVEENPSTKFSEEDNLYGFVADPNADYDGIPKARDEDYCRSIILCCCPRLSWLSFIAIITLVELAVFIITCCINGLHPSALLAPSMEGIAWGWSDVRKIREEYQIWRFITPTILHGNLEHIAGNFVG